MVPRNSSRDTAFYEGESPVINLSSGTGIVCFGGKPSIRGVSRSGQGM